MVKTRGSIPVVAKFFFGDDIFSGHVFELKMFLRLRHGLQHFVWFSFPVRSVLLILKRAQVSPSPKMLAALKVFQG